MIPKSKFKCQRCLFGFEFDKPPGFIHCPKCGNEYVDWLNYVEVLKAMGLYGGT